MAPVQSELSSTRPLYTIAAHGCEDYRINLWTTWLRWVFGELGHAPKILAMWLSNAARAPITEFLMERWDRLEEAVSAPSGPSHGLEMADHIIDSLETLSNAGIHVMDLKPDDVVVKRHQGGTWRAGLAAGCVDECAMRG